MTTANLTVIGNVLFKRGNTTVASAYTGVPGEIIIDTTLQTIRIQDGVTPGGQVLASAQDAANIANANVSALLSNAAVQATSINAFSANLGAYQIFANANAATQATSLVSVNANVTAANAAIQSLSANIGTLVAGAPGALDTLIELGNALGNNASFSATVVTWLGNITSNVTAANSRIVTLDANLGTATTNITTLFSNAATQAGSISTLQTQVYANANVATYLSAFDGNILPAANVTYSLGSSTRQWRDLWVSNNTIYIGNTPVRVDGGTLLVNGAPVGGSYNNANVAEYLPTYSGNVRAEYVIMSFGGLITTGASPAPIISGFRSISTAGNAPNEGNITASGNLVANRGAYITGNVTAGNINASQYNFANGVSILAGITGTYSNANVATYLPTYTGNIAGNIVKSGYTWTFDNSGNLTFPTGNLTIFPRSVPFSNAAVIASALNNLVTLSTGVNGGTSSLWVEDYENIGTSNIAAVYANPTVGSKTVRIAVGQNGGAGPKLWNFDATGTLTTPGNITLPNGAVIKDTAGDAVAFGENAGQTSQGAYAVAIGAGAGQTGQGANSVAIGQNAGVTGQQLQSVAVGLYAGSISQGQQAVAIGQFAGQTSQGQFAVAIGGGAGDTSQGTRSVAIGNESGKTSQGNTSVAIGNESGRTTQGIGAVAVGYLAGTTSQGVNAVAVGIGAGAASQGASAVAIGDVSGYTNQGVNAVAIGKAAGATNQANNSIIINATGNALEQTTANTFTVAPVRNDVANVSSVMFYNTTSKEITYGNTISVAGNILASNIIANVTPAITSTPATGVGYIGMPQNATGTATLTIADAGRHIYVTSTGQTITIPANSSVAYPIGTTIAFIGGPSATTTTIAITTDTMYLAGTGTTGSRTLAANGMATAVKVASTTWYINGTGLT